jgi:hypothetical protein
MTSGRQPSLRNVETLPNLGCAGSIRHHVKVYRGTRFHLESAGYETPPEDA